MNNKSQCVYILVALATLPITVAASCQLAGSGGHMLAASGSVFVRKAAQPAKAEWKLVWSDEFDGKDIDKAKWDFDTGNGFFNYDANVWINGWGNDELQYYTREPENAFV